jgi:hypothetical protein
MSYVAYSSRIIHSLGRYGYGADEDCGERKDFRVM